MEPRRPDFVPPRPGGPDGATGTTNAAALRRCTLPVGVRGIASIKIYQQPRVNDRIVKPPRAMPNVASSNLGAFPTPMTHERRLTSASMRRRRRKTGAQRMPSPAKSPEIPAAAVPMRIIDAIAVAVRFEPMLPCRIRSDAV
jgi:hypothetical protein